MPAVGIAKMMYLSESKVERPLEMDQAPPKVSPKYAVARHALPCPFFERLDAGPLLFNLLHPVSANYYPSALTRRSFQSSTGRGHGMRRKGLVFWGAVALLLAGGIAAVAATVLVNGNVTVIGMRRAGDGGNILCRGAACAGLIESLTSGPFYMETEVTSLIGDEPIDRSYFCSHLKNKRPPSCTTPPSTPGFDPGWKPGGCGAGGWEQDAAALVAGGVYGSNFSGHLDEPLRGVSFLPACGNHDRCWGLGNSRTACDEAFHQDLRSLCAASAGGNMGVCNGFAAGYYSIVSASARATNNYNRALAQRECAAWHSDMQVNGCPK